MAEEQSLVAGKKLGAFWIETRREIAKITWPSRREITTTTTLIVVFALVFGLFFLMVDQVLGFIVSKILGM